MKRIFVILLLIQNLFCYAQNNYPFDVIIRDVENQIVSSKSFYNIGKPIIVDFWRTDCAPCIDLLNSYKEVYIEWQKRYGVKIIVISTDRKIKRKKALAMIKENEWPFDFYFDYNSELYKIVAKTNVVPVSIIYDEKFNILNRFIGVDTNFGYKLINGEISKERVGLGKKNKYSHLFCDLTKYESTLDILMNKN